MTPSYDADDKITVETVHKLPLRWFRTSRDVLVLQMRIGRNWFDVPTVSNEKPIPP